MLNISCMMQPEVILKQAHNISTIPSLIILWISFLILMPLVALIFKSGNTNWGRFFWMWFITLILTGIILLFLIFSPNAIQFLVNFFSNLT